jgi:hypothetical protein
MKNLLGLVGLLVLLSLLAVHAAGTLAPSPKASHSSRCGVGDLIMELNLVEMNSSPN